MITTVLYEVIKRVRLPFDPWAGPRHWRLSPLFPVLGIYILPTVPTFSRTWPWESRASRRPSGLYPCLNPVKFIQLSPLDKLVSDGQTYICVSKTMAFPVVMYGCESWTTKQAECSEEVMFSDCGVGVDSWKSLGLQGDQGNQFWIFIRRTDVEAEVPGTLATWCEELTYWKRLRCWEIVKVGWEGDDRGWDGWMALLMVGHEFEQAPGDEEGQGSLACCNPSQRVEHNWVIEQQNKLLRSW